MEGLTGRYRQYRGVMARLVTGIAVVLSLYHLAYALGLFWRPSLYLVAQSHAAISLGLCMVLVFLLVPATKKGPWDKPSWLDVLFILVNLAGNAYIFFIAGEVYAKLEATSLEMVLGITNMLVIMEAARRLLGVTITLLAFGSLFYARFAGEFPGVLWGVSTPVNNIVRDVWLLPVGVYGLILDVVSTLVAVFILFSAFLQVSGAAKFLIDLALSVAGQFKGGPAKVAVVASSLMGTISGAAVANVVTTGTITIPMMKEVGYKPHVAGAVEAVSSVGGQIMPPVMGAVAFILADFIQMPYWQVCIAAALPAVLYYVATFMFVHFEAVKTGISGAPKEQLPSLRTTLKEGWHYSIPFAVLVYALGVLSYSPQTSCLYATGSLIVVSMFRKRSRLTPGKFVTALENGSRGYMELGAVAGAAGIILAAITMTGSTLRISSMLIDLSGGMLLPLLLLAAITSLILGMGLPSTVCYVMLAMLVAPAMVKLGVPLIGAHLFVYYFGMAAHFTPPVGVSAFVAAAIANAGMMRTGFQAMRIGLVAYIIPFFFVYSPVLLMMGKPASIVLAVVTSIVGATALAAGQVGCLLYRLCWWERVLLFAAGLALITPGWASDLVGIAMIGVAVTRQVLPRLKSPMSVQTPPGDLL